MKRATPALGRRIVKGTFVLMAAATGYPLPNCAIAKDFPTQNVQIVVPFTPGATVDATARIVASKLAAQWKHNVVVDNRPGAASSIGARYVAQAAPNGHTLLFTISDTFTVTPRLPNYQSFRPDEDLVPVTLLAKLVNAIVVNPAAPFDTLPAMIEFARANPGRLRYGSAGPGSNMHLAMEMLKSLAKVDIVHVPYKGISPATTATMSGEVEMTFAGYSAKGLIDAGRLKPIVIAGPDRLPAFATIPTTAELGYPRADSSTWLMLAAPVKTPKEVVDAISDAVRQVLVAPEVRKELTEGRGLIVQGMGPAESAKELSRLGREHADAVRISGADRE
jgi:tripartite-type tricarboxylate transporter receptor subunit TctC